MQGGGVRDATTERKPARRGAGDPPGGDAPGAGAADEGARTAGAGGGARRPRLAWLSGVLILIALILVVTHVGEERRFARLLSQLRPAWILAAVALQAGTYLCAAAVWHRALRESGEGRAFRTLVPLGLAKLFTDQAVPSGGMSGTLLVLRALARRGVSRGAAVAAMLVGLLGYYGAYALSAAAAVVILWALGDLSALLLWLAAFFSALVAAVPLLIVWLQGRAAARPPRWTRRIPALRTVMAALAEAPPESLKHPRLVTEAVLLQIGVFCLDAATLDVMLRAVGVTAAPGAVFAAFVMASVVATLAWVPGGLGAFEGTCVGMLSLLGVPAAAGLAATLLLRGFTFWLPMLPGLWLARRELSRRRSRPRRG